MERRIILVLVALITITSVIGFATVSAIVSSSQYTTKSFPQLPDSTQTGLETGNSTGIPTVTFTGTETFYPVSITPLNTSSVSAEPGATINLTFSVNSPVQGSYYAIVTEPNAFISPSLTTNTVSGSGLDALPSGIVSVNFPSGATTVSQSQFTLPMKIELSSSAPAETITLQLTVFQHQSAQAGGYVDAEVPIQIEVS